MKYTQKEIQEFAKMGYQIDSNGNLIKEVRLQKIVRVSAAAQTISSIELTESSSSVTKEVNRKSSSGYTKLNSRVEEHWLDPERLERGLVTEKQKGVDYSLLPDGTKVCRCCQNRYSADNFYKAPTTKDELRITCKQCQSNASKTYIFDLKAKGLYKTIA